MPAPVRADVPLQFTVVVQPQTRAHRHVQVVSTSSFRLSGGGGLLTVVLAAVEVGGRRYGVAAVAACDAAAPGAGKEPKTGDSA